MKLNYARPERAMHPAFQWVLGLALGVVVVVTVGFTFGASQGPVGSTCGSLAAAAGLALWANRLRRGGYYGHLFAAVWTGIVLGLVVVGLATASVNWA